jgi:hypothetical protein
VLKCPKGGSLTRSERLFNTLNARFRFCYTLLKFAEMNVSYCVRCGRRQTVTVCVYLQLD